MADALFSYNLLPLKGKQSILAKQIISQCKAFRSKLLRNFGNVTTPHVSNIYILFQIFQAINHILVYFLSQLELCTFLGFVKVPSTSNRHMILFAFIVQCKICIIQYPFNVKFSTNKIQKLSNYSKTFNLISIFIMRQNFWLRQSFYYQLFYNMSSHQQIANFQKNAEGLQKKLKLDFYKLHYPTRASPKTKNKVSNKLRSKSVVSVLQSHSQYDLDSAQYTSPKGSIRKSIANRSSIQEHPSSHRQSKIYSSSAQKVSFIAALSPANVNAPINISSFPVSSYKDVQQLSKKNMNIRLAMQKAKDEKIKLNRIVLSHKQSQQIKLQYLKNKRQEIDLSLQSQIKFIYEQFFKNQYEKVYGDEAQNMFVQKIDDILEVMACKIFNKT